MSRVYNNSQISIVERQSFTRTLSYAAVRRVSYLMVKYLTAVYKPRRFIKQEVPVMDDNATYFADDESGYGSESALTEEMQAKDVQIEDNECVYDKDWIIKTQGALSSLLHSRLLSRLDVAAKRGELMVRNGSVKKTVK